MNYKKLVPPDSFIGQYMQYMSNVETAESYDFWCALWAIGASCGRTVFVDRPSAPVYLNWYIILAAESGTTRKSSAIHAISRFVERDESLLLTGKTSPEALDILIHQQTKQERGGAITFAVSELVTILGREGYMSSMPGLLTDLYDCPAQRISPGTLKSGELIQKNVYINFISASTPAWLVTAINPSVIEGGFTSRVIFVVDDTRKRSIAWPTKREDDTRGKVQRQLRESTEQAKSIGSIAISQGGLKKFTNWYNSRTSHTDPFLSSFEAREDDHVLRCAACLCINDGTLEIQSGHITKAIQVISNAKSRANGLFGGDFSQRARVINAISKVRDILIEAGTDGIRHTDLYNKVARKTDTKELRMLMNIMHECGMVQIFKVHRGEMYRATKSIEKFGVASEVLAKLNLD